MVGTAACSPPDRPPRLPSALPAEVVEYVRPDTVRTLSVGAGVWYRYLWSPLGPWAVHLVEADLGRCELGLEIVRAPATGSGGGGRLQVSRMAGVARPGALAAVNGDFFTGEGMPVGPELAGGELRGVRERPAFSWAPGDDPWIGRTRVVGDTVLEAGWPIPVGSAAGSGAGSSPRSAAGTDEGALVGGLPVLLRDGRRVGGLMVEENPGFAASRHPRTAVGWTPATDRLWLVVVDGRQGEYSSGMTLPELTRLFEALAVTEALNLDGGGSSVLVMRGRAVSRPSDDDGERAVVNALVLRQDAERYCVVTR